MIFPLHFDFLEYYLSERVPDDYCIAYCEICGREKFRPHGSELMGTLIS